MRAESNLGGLLGKSSRLLANSFNSDLVKHDLTVEQWSLLALLWSEDHQSQKSLQEGLLKDKATINSLLKYLSNSGFVKRKKDEKDKRSVIVSLSEKGRLMQSETIPIAMKNIGIATENISAEELHITMKVLTQIISNLTKERE